MFSNVKTIIRLNPIADNGVMKVNSILIKSSYFVGFSNYYTL